MKCFLYILFTVAFLLKGSAQNPLSVSLSKSDKGCYKGNATVNVSEGKPPYKIKWSTGDSDVVSIANLAPDNYNVRVKDDEANDTIIGFSIEDTGCEVAIANHFTPNEDGFNDTWYINNISHYPNFELNVYNRSGQLVHQQSFQYVPWDGRWLGIKVPDATYYYLFYFDRSDKGKFLKGDLTILR